MSTRYEGRFSYDERYWGATAPGQSWHPVGFLVYDLALDRQGREAAVFQDIDTDHSSTVDLATGVVADLWPIDFWRTAIGPHLL